MKTKYTPGPWTISNSDFKVGPFKSQQWEISGKNRHVCTVNEHVDDIKIDQSNVNLITSAPDMFEALEHIVAYFAAQRPMGCGVDDDRGISPYADAINAIKKAKGKL